jgi:hypothetical protein
MNNNEYLNIYQVRKILISRGIDVPLNENIHDLATENGFTFDEESCLWTESLK